MGRYRHAAGVTLAWCQYQVCKIQHKLASLLRVLGKRRESNPIGHTQSSEGRAAVWIQVLPTGGTSVQNGAEQLKHSDTVASRLFCHLLHQAKRYSPIAHGQQETDEAGESIFSFR